MTDALRARLVLLLLTTTNDPTVDLPIASMSEDELRESIAVVEAATVETLKQLGASRLH